MIIGFVQKGFLCYLGKRKHHGKARVGHMDTSQNEDEDVELMEGIS